MQRLHGLAAGLADLSANEPLVRVVGRVSAASHHAVQVEGLSRFLQIGTLVALAAEGGEALAEVIKIERDAVVVRPLGSGVRVKIGAAVWPKGTLRLRPDESWKGRLIDGLGRAIDGGPALSPGPAAVRITEPAPQAMSRRPVGSGVITGVRVIDVFTPICLGQRVGIFAGSGVGKSSLLSMMARADRFQTVVVALVGERSREVREFVEDVLGTALGKAVVVAATGDESALMRRFAPLAAMAIAEFFRDRGEEVLLVMDSVTRYAHACRDVALSAGEAPVARGFPPSVFGDLPHLLERAGPGRGECGSITGVFSVLIDGDDHNDPVADAIRSTLDGHIVLDRRIAEAGRYPAVDILASLSRLSRRVWTADQSKVAAELRRLVARYEESRDLRAMGGYQTGADEELDRAVMLIPKLYRVLSQSFYEPPCQDGFRAITEGLA
ncbi:MAG: flagellar protein export ATPase FliI [Rhizobiales bacterium]|nr:flagellar protein export ATPase FliI [Hyphomicrobiales bacterium]